MNAELYKLRNAFARFFAANRDLRQAYRNSRLSHARAEDMSKLTSEIAVQLRNDSAINEELQDLKDENKRLKRSLALLHTYSLSIRQERDNLLMQKVRLLDAYDSATSSMRDDHPVEEKPRPLQGGFADAFRDRRSDHCA